MKISITINELVIDGFGAIDRHQIGSALKLELGRLVKKEGLPNAVYSGNNETRYIKTSFALESHNFGNDDALAREIALSIFRI